MTYVKIGPHATRVGFHPINVILWFRRAWHQGFGHPEARECAHITDELYCERCMAFLLPTPHGDFYSY